MGSLLLIACCVGKDWLVIITISVFIGNLAGGGILNVLNATLPNSWQATVKPEIILLSFNGPFVHVVLHTIIKIASRRAYKIWLYCWTDKFVSLFNPEVNTPTIRKSPFYNMSGLIQLTIWKILSVWNWTSFPELLVSQVVYLAYKTILELSLVSFRLVHLCGELKCDIKFTCLCRPTVFAQFCNIVSRHFTINGVKIYLKLHLDTYCFELLKLL